MKRILLTLTGALLMYGLTACGGGSKSSATSTATLNKAYTLESVTQASNDQSISLQTILTGVNNQTSGQTTCAATPGELTPTTLLTIWVGDYSTLKLGSENIANVALMINRKQVYFSTLELFLGLTDNASSLSGEQTITVPKGTREVWYEFYCNGGPSGTLAAGKVSV